MATEVYNEGLIYAGTHNEPAPENHWGDDLTREEWCVLVADEWNGRRQLGEHRTAVVRRQGQYVDVYLTRDARSRRRWEGRLGGEKAAYQRVIDAAVRRQSERRASNMGGIK